MGTNFYLQQPIELNIHGIARTIDHIGKLSLAGNYCWSCEKSMCVQGKKHVHDANTEWYLCCPICGRTPSENIATVKTDERETNRVRPCNSFSWAITPKTLNRIAKIDPSARITDKMGYIYTIEQFQKMLDIRCPIRFEDSIWKEFS